MLLTARLPLKLPKTTGFRITLDIAPSCGLSESIIRQIGRVVLNGRRTASVIPDLRAKQGQQKRRALRNGARCRGRWCARLKGAFAHANGRWQRRTFHHVSHKQLLKLSVFTGQLREQELENSRCRRCPRLPQRSVLAKVSLSLDGMRTTPTGRGGRVGRRMSALKRSHKDEALNLPPMQQTYVTCDRGFNQPPDLLRSAAIVGMHMAWGGGLLGDWPVSSRRECPDF